ncbi:hypothetical protein HF861_07775 [Faecalicoccus pleomorphus]|uniref:Uncharacterized protein n=1 Tax=Faecalicoccus pleomorphus TaxID=1323 RepID=A0A7X9NJ80_9FIRM|nr:hypothetical protein [Faecalicoccus pleomorphus]NME44781.1 hypothetical protein [Faecalicoccus pleomorphus]
MAINLKNRPKKEKKTAPKQGHKIVWFTLIVILIPFLIIGYVILTSLGGQNEPVVGNRFDSKDLNPAITNDQISQVQTTIASIGGVENVEVNLKSATLRISIDVSDDANADTCNAVAQEAYNQVNGILPVDTYFTNTEEAKMYDLEIDAYNFLLDDTHTEGQVDIKVYKSGAGQVVTQNMTEAKDPELAGQLVR